MNPYSTELRRAMTLADQILALKQNRGLVRGRRHAGGRRRVFPRLSPAGRSCAASA